VGRQAAEARAVKRVRYDTTVERLEAQFPALNLDHADFDKAKTAEVLELKEPGGHAPAGQARQGRRAAPAQAGALMKAIYSTRRKRTMSEHYDF